MTEGRRVRSLRLRAATPALVQRGALLLEDALRTASLPDPGRGRVLFIRRLPLGVIRSNASPSSVALSLERRVQALASDAVHAEAEGAANAGAVFFADAVEALVAVAARLGGGPPMVGWFWPLVAPEAWGKPRDQALRAVLNAALETEPGPAAAVALVEGLVAREAAGPMLGALRWTDGAGLARAFWGRVPEVERGVLLARAPSPELEALPPRVRALVEEWVVSWGPEDLRSMWLGAVALSISRPARVVEQELPARAVKLVAAVAAAVEAKARRPEAPAERGAPRAPPHVQEVEEVVERRTAEEPVGEVGPAPRRAQGPGPAEPERREAELEVESATPAQPRREVVREEVVRPRRRGRSEAVETPLKWPDVPQPTQAGGLLFLVHALEYLGIPEVLAAQPELQERAVAEHFLAWLAARLGVPPEDPVFLALRVQELPPLSGACAFELPERFRERAGARAPWRQVWMEDGRQVECDARGRMILAVRRHGAPSTPSDLELLLRTLYLAIARLLRTQAKISLRELVLRPARVSSTKTHLDILLDHRQAELRIRRAGLDVDPGWVPWLGRVIRYHYIHGELLRPEHLSGVVAMATSPRPLRTCALAALGHLADPGADALEVLRAPLEELGAEWPAAARAAQLSPAPEDLGLVQLARHLGMSVLEVLSVALALAVEEDPRVGGAVSFLQAPIDSSRPTLGLLARAFAGADSPDSPDSPDPLRELASGPALSSGLLSRVREDAPLTEQAVSLPLPQYLSLCGRDADWPGATIGMGAHAPVPLPDSILETVRRHAAALAEAPRGALVVRCASPAEGRSVVTALCRELGRRPLFIEADRLAGLGPFLLQRGLLPVHVHELGPGERKPLPSISHYRGPVLALIGREGTLDCEGHSALRWSVSLPEREERRALWEAALGEGELPAELARQHRQGAGRISQLGALARRSARLAGREHPAREDVLSAAWSAEGGGLGTLAEGLPDPVGDDALVLPPELASQLQLLLLRCRARDGLHEGLGPSTRTRYRSGVRALFVGPSGTGKTLAAGWLATRLSLPLYRVDLASVTSKYIGETEKNLAQLFALAEHGDLILLFDEADSLFGKRTDVRDSNDRFANAQTNYLLQRIESFEGIAVLTSNSKSRFDTAFMRRLDSIVDFPMPGPAERRSLWEAHLGPSHVLPPRDLGKLVAVADLTGGQIRNAVLTAAVLAREGDRSIELRDIVRALHDEYRKVGRELPLGAARDRRRA